MECVCESVSYTHLLSLLTADAEIGRDAVTFFQNMLIGNLNGYYRRLLVAPVAIKRTILKLCLLYTSRSCG